MSNKVLIPVNHLFDPLDQLLMNLLRSLTPAEWEAPTVAKRWKVKDVAAHLLDGNIRALSLERDKYFGTPGPVSTEFEVIVDWLNQFNNNWVDAAKRISPSVMILLHGATGKLTTDYFTSLHPDDKSIFPVDWAGEKESNNRMHIARQYTEKFLHQQQIRDAVNKQGIMTHEYFYPFISILFYALPHTFRNIKADKGTLIRITVDSEIGGKWKLEMMDGGWELEAEIASGKNQKATTEVIIDPDSAWKLFSKSWRPSDVRNHVVIKGNQQLGETALSMVSFMA